MTPTQATEITAAELVVMTKADAQGLLEVLDRIKATPDVDQPEVAAAGLEQLGHRGWEIRATDIARALSENPDGLGDRFGFDLAWQIHNDVQDTASRWQSLSGAVAGRSAARAAQETDDAVRPLLTRIISNSASLIPDDAAARVLSAVEKGLEDVAVGKTMDFNDVVTPYLTDAEARAKLLEQLSNSREFAGAVDAKRGLIYRVSPNKWYRWFTYISPILFFCLTGGALIGISALHGIFGNGYPTQLWANVNAKGHALFTAHKLLGPYLLVMAGVVAHLAVENVKQGQAGIPILATEDLLIWVHLRWVELAKSYLPVIVVVVGLSVLGVGDKGHDLTLWLSAGYSVDSVAGLILNRFGTASTALAQVEKTAKPPASKQSGKS